MNGASALIRTLADCGVELCLANPGTSEVHLVQALDAEPRIRSVLALFEGVCTGAADGYGRMTGKPALTLLHLGPGFANGIANLHNARRANTPIINIVGNHPDYHLPFDAPLTSNIETLANNVSAWVRSTFTAAALARDGADAYTAALTPSSGSRGRIATLIPGADAAWDEAAGPAMPNALPIRAIVDEDRIAAVAHLLEERGSRAMLLLEHHGVEPEALEAAGRIATATSCRLMTSGFPARIDGGPEAVKVERLPYFPEHVLGAMQSVDELILVGGQTPVSFFAYRGTPSQLTPDDCRVTRLSAIEEDAIDALARLVERLGAEKSAAARFERRDVPKPTGRLDTKAIVQAVAATLPENVIVCTDSGAGNVVYPSSQSRVPNSWLSLTGGSIGQGGPCSTGAAFACPDRPVLALLGDGGAAYTNQCFWTQAREGLNVTSVIFANRSYNILNVEYQRLGVGEPGEVAASLFDIGRPAIDWVGMAKSFGVPGARAETAEDLGELLERGFATPGPFVIEAQGHLER
jgi:acetolactate synthase-1/2/3 large subunit